MDALADNGFLYMLTTVLVEMLLVAVAVWLFRLFWSRVEESHHYEQCVNVIEVAYLTSDYEPGRLLRDQLAAKRARPKVPA